MFCAVPIIPNTTENISQPIRSFIMADEITSIPIRVLKIPISMSMRAITGSAVIAMDVPMNSANASRFELVFISKTPGR